MPSTGAATGRNVETSDRRQAIMLGDHREERTSNRLLYTAAVEIEFDGARHLGLVRDLSFNGMFMYSDFQPAVGARIHVGLKLTKDGSKTVSCNGKVIRVVTGCAGAATGIAVQVDEYELRMHPAAQKATGESSRESN